AVLKQCLHGSPANPAICPCYGDNAPRHIQPCVFHRPSFPVACVLKFISYVLARHASPCGPLAFYCVDPVSPGPLFLLPSVPLFLCSSVPLVPVSLRHNRLVRRDGAMVPS